MEHPKHILKKLSIRPRKKWGQNFLVNPTNAKSIVDFADPDQDAFIMEIGPGIGAMTEILLQRASSYIGIELDPILHAYVQKQFPQSHAHFVCEDFLNLDLSKLIDQRPLTVIANLPYHITTPIIEKLLGHQQNITKMTFLLQREVVARMMAGPGSKTYGRLSVWIQTLCDVEAGPILKPGCFMPPPDVDSQVISLIPKKHQRSQAFYDFVSLLFQKRRKTLGRILKDDGRLVDHVDSTTLSRRPGDLSIDELGALYDLVASSR